MHGRRGAVPGRAARPGPTSAIDTLDALFARALAILRIFAVTFEAAVVLVWHGWYSTPAHLVVPVVVAGWGIASAVAFTRTGLGPRIGAAELAAALLLAATLPQAVPPALLGAGPNWAMVRIVGASMALAWCIGPLLWAVSSTTLVAVAVASCLLGGVPPAQVAASGATMAFSSVLIALASRVPRRGALAADAALAAAGERRRIQAVATARHRDLREAERVLHDTVLNTLTGLAWGGAGSSDEAVAARCRHSVGVCTELLAGGDGGDGGIGTKSSLARRLAEAAEGARRDGLEVELTISGRLDVPAEVGRAIAAAAGEALSNVRRHAGADRASVRAAEAAGETRVTVTDDGAGFEPRGAAWPDGADAPRASLGIRYSIMERMADVGGSAEVSSAPGRGTTVTLGWSATPVPDEAVLAETRMLERSYARDALGAVGLGAALWQLGLGLLLAARWRHYTDPVVVVAAWVAAAAALAWCVSAVRRGPLSRPAAALLVAAVLGMQLAAGVTGHEADPVPLNWELYSPVGVVAFLTVSLRVRDWLPAVLAMAGAQVALVGWRYGADLTVVSRVGLLAYAQVGFQVGLSVLWRSRGASAAVTARAAQAEVDLVAERAAAVAIRDDRRLRLAQLAEGPLPLLTDVGAARLHPRDPDVRARSASCAAALRRTLTRQLAPPPLVAALEDAVLAAERRGAQVEVQIAGDLAGLADGPPRTVRDEVVGAVTGTLEGIAAGQVLITLIGDARTGSAFVSFTQGVAVPTPRLPGPVARRWVDVVAGHDDGRGYVEVCWPGGRQASADSDGVRAGT